MAETYKKLAQGQLPSSAGTIYTVPSGTSTIIKHIRLVNTDSSARTARLYHDGTNDATTILPAASIEAGGWAEFEGTIVMEAADTLAGLGSVASQVTYTIYGLELS